MAEILKYKIGGLSPKGSFYRIPANELRKMRASQFNEGDIIEVSSYYIHIKYGNFDTPALCTWIEDKNFKPIGCTPGSSR